MTEQEEQTLEEKETEESNEETPVVTIVEDINSGKKSKYDDKHLYDYIVEMKNNNWSNVKISEGLKQQGYDVPATMVTKLYRKGIVKSTTVHNTANDKFTDYSASLNIMQGQALRALRRWIDYINSIGDQLEESTDMSTLQKQIQFVHMAPQIKMALSELRETIKDYKAESDKIITEKSKQMMTVQELIDNINHYFVPVFKEMSEPTPEWPDGRIEIHDKSVLKE
jgi:hypothetical protein